MQLILASASPRRKEILGRILPQFDVIPAQGEERANAGLSPEELVITLARQKAEEVYFSRPDAAVLGADTIVWFAGKVLGKPKDAEDAKSTLRSLSGKVHEVYTGYCLCTKEGERIGAVRTRVRFHELTQEFIDEYVASGSPMDKAGSYGIQDDARLVAGYEGSYTNIVGLPEEETRELLKAVGIIK